MNHWKLSTLALTLAFGVVAGGARIPAAHAGESNPLESALGHLRAAQADLESAETHHHHGHHRGVVAVKEAIRAVEKEIEWEEKHGTPKDPGPTPKDPPGPTPKNPPGPAPKL